MVEIYRPIGVDVAKQTSTPLFKLGTRAYGEQDQEYLYVLSSGAIAQWGLAAIDENFTARACTTTLAGQANGPGWAQLAFATDTYGWIPVNGRGLFGLCRDNVAADAQLYATASAGKMTATASTGNPLLINGVRTAAAAASGGGKTAIIAVYPSFSPHHNAVA
jgi:hypothetical protein